MTVLEFSVVDIAPEPYAVTPNLIVRLRIKETTGACAHAIALRCQVRIEPQRRRYDVDEEAGLLDLFGSRDRWGSTLKPFLWMQTATMVQGFTGSCEVDLPMTCTYDFEVTAAKYLHALREGTVPLVLLFSGTVFTTGAAGFGVEQVPWDRVASYDLPVRVWRDLVRMHFPGTGYVRLEHGTLAALARFKAARGHTGLDDAVTDLLAGALADEVREVRP